MTTPRPGVRDDDFDWLIVSDDDIAVPPRFLDRLLGAIEQFDFKLAQPAHAFRSYATYSLTRRHWAAIARRTACVEIGPLVAFHRDLYPVLLPFPMTGMGWGLGAYWSALARDRGWNLGIVDAVPIRHLRPIGGGYSAELSTAQAREFLATRARIGRRDALRTICTYKDF